MEESTFQRACDEFVSREVYCCVSTMTEYILKKAWEDRDAPFSNEDIENPMQSGEVRWKEELYIFTTEDELEEWKDEQLEEIDHELDMEVKALQLRVENNEITEDEYDKLESEAEENADDDRSQIEMKYDEAKAQLGEHKEILEYWIVSPYLISKLQERNEAVIESEQIWCRCTSGQAIAIDGAIREIVKEQLIARSEWDEEAKQILL